jgi:outer membrane protein OmpA-like peptidoglycan-associated protein
LLKAGQNRGLGLAKVAALVAVCVLAAPGLAESRDSSGRVVNGIALEDKYVRDQSVWPADALSVPARQAQIVPPVNPAVVPLSLDTAARLRIGMTPDQVLGIAGQPLSMGGNRRWQYLVRGNSGLFIGTVWFNNENKLWMADTRAAPDAQAAERLRPLPQRLVIDAAELFAFDSDRLVGPVGSLDRFAQTLAGRGDLPMIQVRGYTDRLGSAAYNRDLSQRRANAVREYLIRAGVPADRLVAVGYGPADPVVACEGVAPRAQLVSCLAPNRRVVVEPVELTN